MLALSRSPAIRCLAASFSTLAVQQQPDRIAKYIARCGFTSRRAAEQLVRDGQISINGLIVDSLGARVGRNDVVCMGEHAIRPLKRARLFLYHKSADEIVSTVSPKPQLKTVFDRIAKSPDTKRLHLPRLVPIGRLDVTTEGLLLLTSSPALATYLSHPDNGFERVYRARVFGEINYDKLEHLSTGPVIEGVRYRPIKVTVERERHRNSWLQVSVTEGKNREVRKVLQWAGLAVNRLIRTRYGPFRLDNLDLHRVREIPIPAEIVSKLKH